MKKFSYYALTILILISMVLISFTTIGAAQYLFDDIKIYTNINYIQDNEQLGIQSVQIRDQLLDIYRPQDCISCPVVIYIHGGYWVLGDKGGFNYKAKAFTAHNYIYISMNYRLAPDYPFPHNVQDVARAFHWVKENIGGYGGNPKQVYILGHSAGGHLAALIALDEQYLFPFDLSPSDIAGIIGLDSAAYYLPDLIAAEPENQDLFYWAFGDNPEDWERASPINYIKAVQKEEPAPPFLLLVAGGRTVSEDVNRSFYERLTDDGYYASMLHYRGKDHVSIDSELGKEGDPVFPAILAWLEGIQNLKR